MANFRSDYLPPALPPGSAGTRLAWGPIMPVVRLLLVAAMVLAVVGAKALAVEAEASGGWLTGPAFLQQLGQAKGINWNSNPLRQALLNLGQETHLAIVLDRRIDPDQRIDLAPGEVPLDQAFATLSSEHGMGWTRLGPVVVFAPADVASRLRTIAEMLRERIRLLPSPLAKQLLAARPLEWPDLAAPRELLVSLAAEASLAVAAPEQIPHDLWAGVNLPPLPLVDRLLLVTSQFDLAFRVTPDPNTLTLVPLPAEPAVNRTYHVGRQARIEAERWAGLAPRAKIRVEGSNVQVRGLMEDHERIAATLPHGSPAAAHRPTNAAQAAAVSHGSTSSDRVAALLARSKPPTGGRPAAAAAEGDKRYTLRAKGLLSKLPVDLGQRLGVEVIIDQEACQKAGISLDQPLSVDVNQVTFDELFTALLQPAGLLARREGKTVRIEPAAAAPR